MEPGSLSPIVNFYAGSRIDRAANSRDDEAAIARHLADPAARFLPVWQDRHLMQRGDADGVRVAMPDRGQLGLADGAFERLSWSFLGLDGGRPLFALDMSAPDAPEPEFGALDDSPAFEALRPLAALLPDGEASLLAQVRGLVHWRRTHRHCGICGLPNRPEQGGHRLACDNGHHHFPRTDPVVIMLVRHGDRALLARGTRFPPETRLFSALAGFIEPGESAEEAVAREVFEEVGVRVRDVRYHSSQPWPYPGSLMLGFHADALDTALTLDSKEIAEARWVTRAQLRDHDALGFAMPNPTAIAWQLVESWLHDPAA